MSYSVHHLPETPSPSLNAWLKSHYSVSSNVVQYLVGTVVCMFYEGASTLHRVLARAHSGVDIKTAWMASCGLLGVAVAVAAWLAFTIIMSSTFIIHALLHYVAVIIAVVGLGLGAAGAFHFSTEVTEPVKPGKNVGGGGSMEHQHQHQHRSPHDYSKAYND